MATTMTPSDAELHATFNPPHGFDETTERREWKMYEAGRAIVAEAGKKLRDLLPEGSAKEAAIEELAELLPLVGMAARGKNPQPKKKPGRGPAAMPKVTPRPVVKMDPEVPATPAVTDPPPATPETPAAPPPTDPPASVPAV